ncbi:hypothetical protein FHS10_004980 [Mucilaginibacter dorajii]|nr:hypothetical protein [Mucilaginibacter dorajii]
MWWEVENYWGGNKVSKKVVMLSLSKHVGKVLCTRAFERLGNSKILQVM